MSKDNFYGKRERMMRHYDSLKNFVGRNEVFLGGDVLYVSTNNNGAFDMVLFADGTSTFNELYAAKKAEEEKEKESATVQEPAQSGGNNEVTTPTTPETPTPQSE